MNKKIINLNQQKIGHGTFTVMAGPCSIESLDQFQNIVQFLMQKQISSLRGGIFKLRTKPESFQGLREEAFSIIKEVKKKHNFNFISEITDPRQLESLLEVTDILQVGTRNMFNYELLKELSHISCPVLLKRGFSARIDEWLQAAEYLSKGGNDNIILCERGIRTFETAYRNTCDINAIAYLKKHTPYPVFLDPSHATGSSAFVIPIASAALAAGADGILVEVHNNPKEALSDSEQALNFTEFENMITHLQKISEALNISLQ